MVPGSAHVSSTRLVHKLRVSWVKSETGPRRRGESKTEAGPSTWAGGRVRT